MHYPKCPICGTENSVGNITPSQGTSFVITEVDTTSEVPNFIPTSGVPVNVKGCTNCKVVFLTSDFLNK